MTAAGYGVIFAVFSKEDRWSMKKEGYMLTKLLNCPAANFAEDERGKPTVLGYGLHHLPSAFEDDAPKTIAANVSLRD